MQQYLVLQHLKYQLDAGLMSGAKTANRPVSPSARIMPLPPTRTQAVHECWFCTRNQCQRRSWQD